MTGDRATVWVLGAIVLLVVTSGCLSLESVTDRPSTASGQTWTVTVTEVVDGDTMEVRFADGETDTIRLLGVDTPEVHGETDPAEYEGIPDTDAGRDHLSAWGGRASAYATERLAGRNVTIAVDPAADRRGSYDRRLVYLHVGDDLFNLRLIERGYARHYGAPHSRHDAFAAAESRARQAGVGLWGYPGTPPGTWTVTPPSSPSPGSTTDETTPNKSTTPTATAAAAITAVRTATDPSAGTGQSARAISADRGTHPDRTRPPATYQGPDPQTYARPARRPGHRW